MARILFHVSYNGAPFHGWQSQPSKNAVQDHIESALAALHKHPVRIHGSGRTDAGVHALDQCFHIDTELSIALDKWPLAINRHLPKTIRIMNVEAVADDFHARYSAIGKTYQYVISTTPIASPFTTEQTWHHPQPLDVALMEQALSLLIGTRSFHNFCSLRGNEPTPLPKDYFERTIYRATLKETPQTINFTFTGEGFLYKMVRHIVGTLAALGIHKITLVQFEDYLFSNAAPKSPYSAPPEGLFLSCVYYSD